MTLDNEAKERIRETVRTMRQSLRTLDSAFQEFVTTVLGAIDADSETELSLTWHGPYSFGQSQDALRFRGSEYRDTGGLYLWTYRFGDEYRVNYVGKTKNFHNRFTAELRYSRNGKSEKGRFACDALIDWDRFLSEGVRVVVNERPTKEELSRARPEIDRTLDACRVFVSVMGTKQQSWTEFALTKYLWERYGEIMHHPANGDVPRVLRNGPPADLPKALVIKSTFESGENVRGLSEPVRCSG
ncbi:MAG: hypothetical protein DWQ35_13815 [Planctomycetota bacterium]|nr:MAG: hypothetical protein DWQ35_13815 [Planctomycetota bacterium]REK25981.1 MAG: hypothetical protein DWQ42_10145 [Planctomycetota bacterium]REK46904.1 MAG: hypothetical protein DWQ46_05260 [Planctomycetota bacterium]